MATRTFLRQALLLGVATTAFAGAGTAAFGQEIEEVVVTGTLIRGVAPVGANVLSISREEIAAIGAVDSNLLLASIPQNAVFNWLPQPGGTSAGTFNARAPITRPNLRNLPGGFAGSGATTLILVDGHRMVASGIEQTAVDVSVIPSAIVERVETILDGVSAIYGSDAVGGVINFITRKRFDSTQADFRYGFADDYWSIDASAASGKSWDSGGISFNYSFTKNDDIRNSDRDYVFGIDWFTGIPTGRNCDPANVTVSGVTYAMPTLARATNACDTSKDGNLYPMQERHSGYVTLSQDITDTITFDMSAFYSVRDSVANLGPFRTTATINTRNPYYRTISGVAGTPTQTVAFTYAPILGSDYVKNQTLLTAGQITPTLTARLGEWEVRGLFSYGRGRTYVNNVALNPDTQLAYITGPTGSTAAIPITSAINPYDVAATQNRALFGDLTFYNRLEGINAFTDYKVTADGPLFALPGGDVRAAVGGEYFRNAYKRRNTLNRLLTPYLSATEKVKAVFGELYVPVVGPENSRPGIDSLILSASGRYDSYNDYGSTFNPKFSVTYGPVDWLAFRGNWGKAFNAPTVTDRVGFQASSLSANTGLVVLPAGFVPPPVPFATLFLTGAADGLSPQKATNWSVAVDVRPPIVPNLSMSLNYYHIDFKNLLGITGERGTTFVYQNLPQYATLYPTPAQYTAFAAQAPNGPAVLAAALASGQTIVSILDGRVHNLGDIKVSGLDFSVGYVMNTSFGSLDAKWAGNYQLTNDPIIVPGSAPVPGLDVDQPRMRYTVTLGATIGDLRAQAVLQHTGGYKLSPSATRMPDQTGVDQYDAINLSFRYNVNGSHPLSQDLALSLTINNLFDADPPVLRANGSSVASGGVGGIRTLGRVVQLGVTKSF